MLGVVGGRESAGTVRDDDLYLLLLEGQPPTTQGALSGLARSHTPAGFSKMPIDGSAWPPKLNRVMLTLGEPMPAPGSQGTPGIQSGAQKTSPAPSPPGAVARIDSSSVTNDSWPPGVAG